MTVSQVNALLQRFEQAAKMMKRMSNRGGMGGGIPGFGGPAMGGGKKKGKNKKKGRQVRQSDEARGRGEGIAR